MPEKFEVALCLNVLHHLGDEEVALQNIKSNIVIFEVNQNQLPLISNYFETIKTVVSHRGPVDNKRVILLSKRKIIN